MATFNVLSSSDAGAWRYLNVRVQFQGLEFDQTIVTDKSGSALEAQLQDYADRYEQDWLQLQAGIEQ